MREHARAAFGNQHIVFDPDADTEIFVGNVLVEFFGNITRVRRNVEAGFDGHHHAGFGRA